MDICERRKQVKESLPSDISKVLNDKSLTDKEKVEYIETVMEIYFDWMQPCMADME